jgi:FSR family fosmidomycin resistance protein-like MFS transporter
MKKRLFLLFFAHFCIDLTTVSFVFSCAESYKSDIFIYIVLAYNILAFASQPFFGLLCDCKKIEKPLILISLCAVFVFGCVNYILFLNNINNNVVFIISLIVFTLSNGLFHSSAGVYVINNTHGASFLGVFVSSGAIGVALGKLYSLSLPIGAILCALIAVFFVIFNKNDKTNTNLIENTENEDTIYILPLVLLIFAVFIRGFAGMAAVPSYKTTEFLIITAAICTALGKAAGGIISDKIGIFKTVLICLPLSAFFLIFCPQIPFLYLLGLVLFNTSMPLTLFLSIKAASNFKGAAFGMCSAALMCGSVLMTTIKLNIYFIAVLILFSAFLIIFAEKLQKKRI